ncbi:MAG TPA: hypothetical protein VHO28_05455, partial [Ignavibacteriales bacterium]|nr:hypothetical protein [Ignavibacteriales bacterium]
EKNVLSALADDNSFAAEFRQWINKKLYKTISVALRPDWSIKHIGFLGAQPPAVTGLPVVEFSSSPDDIVIELSEGELSAKQLGLLSSLFSGIKNYFIEKEGEEKAEELIPASSLEEMTKPAEEPEQKDETLPDEEADEEKPEEEIPAAKEEGETDPAKKKKGTEKNLSEHFIALQLELKTAKEEADRLKKEARRKEHLAFCESAEAAVKIKPSGRNAILGLMEILYSAPVLEFSEGDETISVNPLDAFKEIIKNQKPVVELSEIAARDKAITVKKEGSPAEISKRALEIKTEAEKLGESMNFAEAVTLASKEFEIL